jgi:hypothetical protein
VAKFAVSGSSYIEVDDAGGTPRDLSRYLEELEPLGKVMAHLDVTGLNDAVQRTIAGLEEAQEFVLRGVYDDTAATGPDAVLGGIVGKTGTVSYGPAGNGSGRRKITGEFICLSYQVVSQAGRQVRFIARFRQDGAVSITTW